LEVGGWKLEVGGWRFWKIKKNLKRVLISLNHIDSVLRTK
jgi:hypothetical protein